MGDYRLTLMFSEVVILALIAAVPPTLTAVAVLVISMRNSKKADAIHVLVNSKMTAVQAELAEAHRRVEQLEKVILMQKKIADEAHVKLPETGGTLDR